MPGLRGEFHRRVSEAVKLAEIGELARSEAPVGSRTLKHLHYCRLELLYELAFVRIFYAWEDFLEQCFLRYLCGYTSSHGGAVLATGVSFAPTLAHATATLLGTKQFLLWHSTTRVLDRCKGYFASCPVQTVVASSFSRLDDLAAIRHRIVHAHSDARSKFDSATMAIAGKRYPGSRPGAFLRDDDPSISPAIPWLERLGREFQGLASQIA